MNDILVSILVILLVVVIVVAIFVLTGRKEKELEAAGSSDPATRTTLQLEV